MSMTACLNCGAPSGDATLTPTHCGDCPPWRCEDCGQMDSMVAPCPCWISLDGMPLADIKGLLALGDLSVDPRKDG